MAAEPLPPIPAVAEARQPALDQALAQLRLADPAFDLGQFLQELQRRFFWVRGALAERRPERLAGQVAPPVLATWRENAARQVAAGVHTDYRGLRVDSVRPIWLVVGPVRDRFTAAFDHSAAVTGLADGTDQVVFGGDEAPGVEYWTVSRPSGSHTPALDSGPAECPGCGAPADLSRGPVCPYCRAELPGALLGWVLERVDQEIEWAEPPDVPDPDAERRRREEQAEDDWVDSQLRGEHTF